MKKYIPFFKAGMMEELSYKAVIYIWVLISVLQLACVLFLWSAVYSNAEGSIINGFTFEQMIVYFVFTNIFAFICLESSTLGMIDDEIKDGTIAISFIKPISYRKATEQSGTPSVTSESATMTFRSEYRLWNCICIYCCIYYIHYFGICKV